MEESKKSNDRPCYCCGESQADHIDGKRCPSAVPLQAERDKKMREIKERLDAITPGKWEYVAMHDRFNPERPLGMSVVYVNEPDGSRTSIASSVGGIPRLGDLVFIASVPTDLRWALEFIDVYEKTLMVKQDTIQSLSHTVAQLAKPFEDTELQQAHEELKGIQQKLESLHEWDGEGYAMANTAVSHGLQFSAAIKRLTLANGELQASLEHKTMYAKQLEEDKVFLKSDNKKQADFIRQKDEATNLTIAIAIQAFLDISYQCGQAGRDPAVLGIMTSINQAVEKLQQRKIQ